VEKNKSAVKKSLDHDGTENTNKLVIRHSRGSLQFRNEHLGSEYFKLFTTHMKIILLSYVTKMHDILKCETQKD